MNNPNHVFVQLNQLFFISTFCTIAWMILMGSSIKPFNSRQIVAFELAGTPEGASKIIADWKSKDLVPHARKSIYLDFVFLILYSASIGIGCVVLSAFTQNSFLIKLGLVLSKIVPLAGIFDVVENLAMLKTLSGEVNALSVVIAYWFALIKFLIVLVALLFVFGCLIFGGVKQILNK